MRLVLWILAAMAALGTFASFAIEAAYEARSIEGQLVRRNGSSWTKVGKPVKMIAPDPEALLPTPPNERTPWFDIDRLNAAPRAVLRLEDIKSTLHMARFGAAGALVLVGLGLAWIRNGLHGPFRALDPDLIREQAERSKDR